MKPLPVLTPITRFWIGVAVLVLILAALFVYRSASGALSATVSWNPNPAPDLAGYKVYRSLTSCAAFANTGALKTVGKTVTSYTDATIPDGTAKVAYKISAFDTSGNESAGSNCVEKTFLTTIPPTDDHTEIIAEINALKARVDLLEASVSLLVQQRDRMKKGLCALVGKPAQQADVMTEKDALGGC